MIYCGKGDIFPAAVEVKDIVSREAVPVFTEQKGFATHPRTSVWPVRPPAARVLGRFGVDEKMECVAPSVVV